ncbi:hypothetical protein [Burkholderia ambifaria]|uniref:hypothetical protein n=1 Tax=Burkholderia ambifaria TaxID=152480 RepID=UPI00158B2BE6
MNAFFGGRVYIVGDRDAHEKTGTLDALPLSDPQDHEFFPHVGAPHGQRDDDGDDEEEDRGGTGCPTRRQRMPRRQARRIEPVWWHSRWRSVSVTTARPQAM